MRDTRKMSGPIGVTATVLRGVPMRVERPEVEILPGAGIVAATAVSPRAAAAAAASLRLFIGLP